YLEAAGLSLERTPVGDRYVVARMREQGFNLGGEQSGHIIFTDYTTTGDGLVAALQALVEIDRCGKPASEVLSVFEPLPQVLKSIRFKAADPLDAKDVRAAIDEGEAALSGGGRLLVRRSGTEPVVRVMAEGEDSALVERVVTDICRAVESAP
ncbi:MAG: phosphoglucosamine mutase, partial [Sphingomonadales bacterium]